MDKQKLKEWLKAEGKDRDWLASQIGCTKGTLDQWFYKTFPEWAAKSINRLINPLGNKASGLELVFNHDEFMEIERAMKTAGYNRHAEFYHDAITDRARDINAHDKRVNISQFPTGGGDLENKIAE